MNLDELEMSPVLQKQVSRSLQASIWFKGQSPRFGSGTRYKVPATDQLNSRGAGPMVGSGRGWNQGSGATQTQTKGSIVLHLVWFESFGSLRMIDIVRRKKC